MTAEGTLSSDGRRTYWSELLTLEAVAQTSFRVLLGGQNPQMAWESPALTFSVGKEQARLEKPEPRQGQFCQKESLKAS